jgi:hypothetical protein
MDTDRLLRAVTEEVQSRGGRLSIWMDSTASNPMIILNTRYLRHFNSYTYAGAGEREFTIGSYLACGSNGQCDDRRGGHEHKHVAIRFIDRIPMMVAIVVMRRRGHEKRVFHLNLPRILGTGSPRGRPFHVPDGSA